MVKNGNKVPWKNKKEFIEFIHINYSDLIRRKNNIKLRKSSYNLQSPSYKHKKEYFNLWSGNTTPNVQNKLTNDEYYTDSNNKL